jgi:hypothetical protein
MGRQGVVGIVRPLPLEDDSVVDFDTLEPKPYGYRSSTHNLTVEGLGAGRFCIRYRDTRGISQYVTGPWSGDGRSARAHARRLIKKGGIAQRTN